MGTFAPLKWDEVGKKFYETGVSHGILFTQNDDGTYANGVAWSGLTGVNETPSGAESTPLYADDIKYLSLMSAEEFGGTITAYYYPDEFEECDGVKEIAPGVYAAQQDRKSFALCYETILGNDVKRNAYGKKIHIVYGCVISPSEKSRTTVNNSPDATQMSWTFTTTPVEVAGLKPTSHIEIISDKVSAENLAKIEKILRGSEEAASRLPLPDELATLLAAEAEG